MKSFFRTTLSIICNKRAPENPFGKETYAPNVMHRICCDQEGINPRKLECC